MSRSLVVGLIVLAATVLAATAPVAAGGLRDVADAWLIPASTARRLLETGEAPGTGWSLAVAQGRLFDVDELPQAGLAVGRRWRRAACRVRWERLGRRLYREDQARLEVLVGERWRLGGEMGLDRLALAGGPARTVAAADLRVAIALADGLRLDVWWSLTDPPVWHGRQGLRRWLRLDFGGEAWAWAAVIDRRATGEPVLQAEVLLRLAPSAALGLRLEPWSGAAGLCTAWRLGSLMLRSSHLVHPELGTTHRWGVDVGGSR